MGLSDSLWACHMFAVGHKALGSEHSRDLFFPPCVLCAVCCVVFWVLCVCCVLCVVWCWVWCACVLFCAVVEVCLCVVCCVVCCVLFPWLNLKP